MARSLASVKLGSSPSASKSSIEGGNVNEDSQWFMSTNKLLPGATAHQRKLDFGLLSVGSDSSGAPVSPEWGTVEVIGEHTDEKKLTQDKFLQFADYARFSMYNQSDRLFLFGLLVHGKKCFVTVFLSTCVVLAQPIDMETECLTLVRLISKIYSAGALGRGRDPRFARYWRTVSIDLGPSDETKCSRLGYSLIYRPESCEESDKLKLVLNILGHFYRTFSLLGRRTHVLLCRVSHIKENETNVQVDDHVVLKVSAIDSASAFDEADLYATLLANGAWAVPIIVATEKKGGNKDTKAFLGDLAETVSYLENPQNTKGRGEYQLVAKKDLQRLTNVNFAHHGIVVNRERRYLVLGTVGVPLNHTDLPPSKLCQAIADVLKTIQSYGPGTNQKAKERVLHRDISVTNILVSIPKGAPIHLDDKTFVRARESTRWDGDHGAERVTAAPFDLDLASVVGKRSNLSALTGTMAFLAPSALSNWGDDRHLHQDIVSCLLCLIWMVCQPPLVVSKNLIEIDGHNYQTRSMTSTPTRGQHIPNQLTIKSLYRETHHPLESWQSGIEKGGFFDNLVENLARHMALKYQILYEQDNFYDCIVEALGSGRLSWKPDVPMQRRLAIKNNRDHAAHQAYRKMMDERAPELMMSCISRLEELAQRLIDGWGNDSKRGQAS